MFLEKRSTDTDSLDSDYIACGDFNVERIRAKIRKTKKDDPIDELFAALQSKGLIVEADIQNSPSNLSQDKHFDQIAYHKYDDSTISFLREESLILWGLCIKMTRN